MDSYIAVCYHYDHIIIKKTMTMCLLIVLRGLCTDGVMCVCVCVPAAIISHLQWWRLYSSQWPLRRAAPIRYSAAQEYRPPVEHTHTHTHIKSSPLYTTATNNCTTLSQCSFQSMNCCQNVHWHLETMSFSLWTFIICQ